MCPLLPREPGTTVPHRLVGRLERGQSKSVHTERLPYKNEAREKSIQLVYATGGLFSGLWPEDPWKMARCGLPT